MQEIAEAQLDELISVFRNRERYVDEDEEWMRQRWQQLIVKLQKEHETFQSEVKVQKDKEKNITYVVL